MWLPKIWIPLKYMFLLGNENAKHHNNKCNSIGNKKGRKPFYYRLSLSKPDVEPSLITSTRLNKLALQLIYC